MKSPKKLSDKIAYEFFNSDSPKLYNALCKISDKARLDRLTVKQIAYWNKE